MPRITRKGRSVMPAASVSKQSTWYCSASLSLKTASLTIFSPDAIVPLCTRKYDSSPSLSSGRWTS
ncbi:hypothetical protein I7I50_08821 [Histoplasma capsulatum G186AR]|uniref:Uncharacterized protein n=1 Tax=Ajellomyces capsulatus TaxID=5037 RepID=A0A8H7YUF7_AJECA|nr:hypothetical protein I7I52_06335 [Histoplasma capsulatum]QSS73888.1 hypothetical protein I7I50_08821 [Histoplasma capsulatum G186AR]